MSGVARSKRIARWAVPAALLALTALTALQVVWVAAGLPYIRSIPGWFYLPSPRGLGAGWAMAGVCVAVPVLARAALRSAGAGRRKSTLALLFVLGLATQVLFIPLDAQREGSLLSRHAIGHGEFHAMARQQRGALLHTLRHFEELVAARRLGVFAPSKPPGVMVVYGGVDALGQLPPLANHTDGLRELAEHEPRLATYHDGFVASVFLFPLLTALLLPLVFAVGVRLHRGAHIHTNADTEAVANGHPQAHESERAAAGAALLTATSPGLLLITYHLDGAVYPLLALLALLPVCVAMGKEHRGRHLSFSAMVLLSAALAGALLALGLYISFSLLPVIPLALGIVAAFALAAEPHTRPWRRVALTLIGFAAGAFAVHAVLITALHYQPAQRFHAAMAYHERWKAGVPTLPWRGWSLLEFSLYAGLPLMATLLGRALGALRRAREARRAPATLLAPGVVVIMAVLAGLSGTNEVARLWLFMVPVVALGAVSVRSSASRIEALVGMQFFIALVMKANQPW